MIRQALIPAAGRGARLDRPKTPKPLVDVGGQPMLLRLLRQLANAGVEHAVVVTGYAAQTIEVALQRADLGLTVTCVFNPEWETGLASSCAIAQAHINGPFVLAMADHVFDESLIERVVHLEPGEDIVALVDRAPSRVDDLPAAVKVRGGDRPEAFSRTLAHADGVDVGLFACSMTLFDALDAGNDLAHAIDALAQAGRVRAQSIGLVDWFDVDRPVDVVRAESCLRQRRRRERVVSDTEALASTHAFTTGERIQTEIVVERGLVANPLRGGIIPAECASSPIFVFTDQTVNRLYGDRFVGRLMAAGYDVHRIVMADGEESKTLANYTHLVERVLRKGIDERSVLISLGGGVVCNVCGMVAATLYRGIRLVHVPTTLMAQSDAAISHKQGLNDARGKNLVGAYYAPQRILVDVDALATLEPRRRRDGMAEVLKHALAQDADFAKWLIQFNGDPADSSFLDACVRKNIDLKTVLMAVDPKEHREGMVLQYGHTVGHPLEHLSGYTLNHGEAVAIGMVIAAQVSRLLGACDDATVQAHIDLIAHYGLPTTVPEDIRTDDVIQALRYNKKFLTEGTRMALVQSIGHLWSVDGIYAIPVSDAVIAQAVERTRVPAVGLQEACA